MEMHVSDQQEIFVDFIVQLLGIDTMLCKDLSPYGRQRPQVIQQ